MTVVHGSSNMPTATTVAIAGGGPSGTYLALALAKHGIESVVIEPRRTIDHFRPRAKTTNARTMTLLAELGLADSVREAAALPVSYSQDVMFSTALTGYELRRFHGAFQLEAGRYEIQPECGQQIPQPDVEEVLRAAAADCPLITYVTGMRATGTDLSDTQAPVLVVTGADPAATADTVSREQLGTHRLSARWIVGADGGSSAVRKSLGIKLSGTTAPKANFNVVFRSKGLRERVTLDPAVQWWIVGDRSGMIGELDRDGTWWTIMQGTDPIEDPDELAAALRTMAGVGEDVDIEILATDSWTARMLLTESESYGYEESGGSVFLVGDAAHLNPPWGGHGFNTCVVDAANLAWKLAAVHAGWANASLLASYGAERRPVAARMISDAAANGKALAFDFVAPDLAVDGSAGIAARARVHDALAVKTSEFHSEGLVVGYEYANTGWVQPGLTPFVDAIEYRPQALPGCLLPHFWRTDGASIYPTRTDFTLFTVDGESGEPQASPAAGALVDAAQQAGIPLNTIRLAGADATRARTLWDGAAALLVRPDRHIAAVLPAPVTTGPVDPTASPADGVLVRGLLTATGHTDGAGA
mgnify:CR=1 FL=1|jgi:2-polyprenyl-6-methoxyphenol hydroxylase-like FAD-dependent oxidoreductase